MSLINDALKKAQRLRLEQQAGGSAPPGDAPAGEIRKRGQPMRAQLLVLLIAAASILVVFSVVITVYLLNRDGIFPASAEPAPPKAAPVVDLSAPSPVIVAPVIPKPESTSETTPTTTPAAASAVPDPVAALPVTDPAVASASATPPAAESTPAPESTPPPPTAAAAKLAAAVDAIAPESHVLAQQFIDALRVTGIRASGEDSKVLMNDRVYRVNDIVDRNLGLKLIKVAPDSLVFSDPTGATYTKIF